MNNVEQFLDLWIFIVFFFNSLLVFIALCRLNLNSKCFCFLAEKQGMIIFGEVKCHKDIAKLQDFLHKSNDYLMIQLRLVFSDQKKRLKLSRTGPCYWFSMEQSKKANMCDKYVRQIFKITWIFYCSLNSLEQKFKKIYLIYFPSLGH